MVYYRWFVQVPSFFLSRLRSLTGLIYFYCCDLIALVGHCQVKDTSISHNIFTAIYTHSLVPLEVPAFDERQCRLLRSCSCHLGLHRVRWASILQSPSLNIFLLKLINPFSPKVATSVGPACADVLRSITKQLEKDIIMGSQNTKTKTLALFNANNLTYEMFAIINSTKK